MKQKIIEILYSTLSCDTNLIEKDIAVAATLILAAIRGRLLAEEPKKIRETKPDCVCIEGLSRSLRLSKRWLLAEAKAGRIPSLLAGKQRLFSVDGVQKCLAKRAAATTSRRSKTKGKNNEQ